MSYNCAVVVHNWVTELPENPAPFNIYFLKTGSTASMYVANQDGVLSLITTNITIPPHNELEGLQGGTTNQYYHLTASEYNSLSEIINFEETGLVSIGNIIQNETNVTLQNVIWKIDGVQYEVEGQLFSINPASEDNYRTDIIVGNSSGVMTLIQGTESTTNPVTPAIPENTVLITVINVFGDSIVIPPDIEIPTAQQVFEAGRTVYLVDGAPISIVHESNGLASALTLGTDGNAQLAGEDVQVLGINTLDLTSAVGEVPTTKNGTENLTTNVNGVFADTTGNITLSTSDLQNDGADGTSRYTQDSEIYESSAINLLDISQVDYTERYSPGGNNIVSRSGTVFVRTDWIPVEEGNTYTLNKAFPYADNTIGLFTAYGTTTSVAKITANTSGNISFTIPEGLAVTHIIINLTTTVVNGTILSSTDYMLNEGFRGIPYISFGSHSYIKDELLVHVDYSKIDDNDLFELRSTNLINVRRVVNTERYSPGGNNIVSRGITRFVRTDWIPVEEGKWYIINKNLNGRGGYFSTYGNTTAVSSIDLISTSQGTSYMFYVPTGQNIKYVVLNLSTTTTTGNTLLYDDYQLEKGGVSTPHKEYLLKPQIKSTYLKDPYNESNLRKYITFDNINYSGTSSKIVKFKEHWIKKDKDLVVVTTGTSLTGRNTEHCTEHAFASSRPPLMNSNNFATHIWDALVWEGQQYRRYDSGGFFTETGTWTTSGGIADWDDNGYRTALTRYSTGAAFIGFGIPSGAWQFNFIYRTGINATENATITIIEGNGLVEVFNGTTWVEANGYVFSQKEPDITLLPSVSYVNPITGATDILTDYQTKGNTTYQKRLKMRCKNHSGLDSRSVGKTVTITNTTGRLTYWGVEWSPREFMITYINAARGSHNGTVDSSLSLLHYQDNDIWGFDPDLLLIENPIHNSGGSGIPDPSYPTTYWGQTTDGFFFENSGVSLKSRAEDLGVFVSDLEWIVYNSSIAYNFGGIDTAGSLIPSTNIDGKVLTALDAQQLSHQWMVDNHPEVMSFNLVKNWVDAALDVYGNLRTSTVGSGKAGLTFTNEGSHWNDTGCKVQARLIVPVFDFNLDNF